MKQCRCFNSVFGLVCLLASSTLLVSACGDDLGACDETAATKLVFGRGNLAATVGQAMAHDTCGNGVFCHSSKATGDNRVGAPHGLDFDMVPTPSGWNTLREHAAQAWEAIDEGSMPPRGVGATKVGNGDWSYDRRRGDGAPRIPSIYSAEGKEIFRNWLACDLPIVDDTVLPPPIVDDAGRDAGDEDSGSEPLAVDWGTIYADIIQPNCVLGGCHDQNSGAGGLKMGDPCGAFDALQHAGVCNKRRVLPGDTDSFLLEKLRDETPSCGFRMPSTNRLEERDIARVTEWVATGAHSEECD